MPEKPKISIETKGNGSRVSINFDFEGLSPSSEAVLSQRLLNFRYASEIAVFDPWVLPIEESRRFIVDLLLARGERVLEPGRGNSSLIAVAEDVDGKTLIAYFLSDVDAQTDGGWDSELRKNFNQQRLASMRRGRPVSNCVIVPHRNGEDESNDGGLWSAEDLRLQMLQYPEAFASYYHPLKKEIDRLSAERNDLTSRLESAHYSLGRSSTDLNALRLQERELYQADARKQFIENMLHKIKNPVSTSKQELTAMVPILEGLQRENEVISKQKRQLSMLLDSARATQENNDRALLMLDELREVRKRTIENLDLAEFSSKLVIAFEAAAVTETFDVDIGPLPKTTWNARYNEQIIKDLAEELFGNAKHFVDPQRAPEYHLKIGFNYRAVPGGSNANYLQFIFSDNGLGVPDDLKAKIFDRTFTSRDRGDKELGGLGLSYLAGGLRELDGTIEEVGKFGEGARFIISIKLNERERG